jgi:protoporphyrin/coproporphyrin ferrochelatase
VFGTALFECVLNPLFSPQVIVLFTAHSLPMRVVNKGDPYPAEIAATVGAVMSHGLPAKERRQLTHVLAWQSKVGFLPWLCPSTGDVITELGRQGHKYDG